MIDALTENALVELVLGAARNKTVREYHHSERWGHLWTKGSLIKNPPIRVHFEHAIVYGTISEAIDIRRSKTAWGKFVGIEPLGPDDLLHPERIVYTLKSTSKMRMRWEFRDSFKTVLGKHRGLVNDAVRQSRKDFLARLDEENAIHIKQMLHLEPADFWSACRRGEQFGPDGIHQFMESLTERTRGYRLPFDVPLEQLR